MNEDRKKRSSPPTQEIPVIGMTSSNGKKNEAARSEHVAHSMLRMASTIVDKIAQRKGFIMPHVPKSISGRSFGAKSGSPLEKLAIMKSGKVDFVVKVAPMPTPFAAETDSPARKEDTACVDLLEDMDACAKFVNGGRKVVYPSSFAKYTTQYKMTALLAMMHI
ncbi:hypothetical protein ACFX13_022060 [Malus domestica]